MTTLPNSASMSQRIFQMGLSVETISSYLLCCGLKDAGKAISMENLLEVWNSTKDVLLECIDELLRRNIIRCIREHEDNSEYALTDPDHWRQGI